MRMNAEGPKINLLGSIGSRRNKTELGSIPSDSDSSYGEEEPTISDVEIPILKKKKNKRRSIYTDGEHL